MAAFHRIFLGAALLTLAASGAFLSGCAPRSERSIRSTDLLFGGVPGTETVLRVKRECTVDLRDGAVRFVLPVGDYIPVYADSKGIFYAVPVPEDTTCPNCPVIGDPWEGWGVYFPKAMRSSSPPIFWRHSIDLEWGRIRGEKERPLPEQCWQPYGTAMAIVRNAEAVPLR